MEKEKAATKTVAKKPATKAAKVVKAVKDTIKKVVAPRKKSAVPKSVKAKADVAIAEAPKAVIGTKRKGEY